MIFNLKQKAGRAGKILGGPLQIMGRSKVLGAILFLALLRSPVPAFSATIPGSYSAALTWDNSPSSAVTGYRVYYGTASGNYANSAVVGNVTTNTVTGLASGVTYFFAITAYDTNGLESTFSNEASFVGLPTVQLLAAANRQFVLTVSGLTGTAYDIQATQDFKTWTVIGTVTTGAGGSVNFTDTNATGFSQRYYRTQQTP